MEDVKMRADEPTLNEALCQGRDEFFFRHSDVVRFHKAFETLVSDANHLLITSPFEGAIEHYAKMMLNRCAMRSGLVVETLMPSSTEALVERFNEFVGKVSVDDARRSQQSDQGRIIVINDVKFIEAESWPLLVRMTNDFPGLKIRLLILLDSLSPSSERVLDRVGSKLVRWNIEIPNAEEQTALRSAGMKAGLEFQIERVLTRINATMSGMLEPDLPLVNDPDSGETGNAAGQKEAEDMRALFDAEQIPPRKSRFILVLSALVSFAVLTTYVFRDHPWMKTKLEYYGAVEKYAFLEEYIFADEQQNPEDVTESVVDAAYSVVTEKRTIYQESSAEEYEASVLPPNSSIAESQNETSAPTEEIRQQLNTDEVDLEESSLGQSVVVVSTADPAVQLVAENLVQTPDNSLEERSNPEPILESVDREENSSSILRSNIRTVQDSSQNSQFIQHLVSAEETNAREWMIAQSGLNKSMIVPVDLGAQLKFAVVSGPFENQAEIEIYIQAMPADADYWVRSSQSLARVLDTD